MCIRDSLFTSQDSKDAQAQIDSDVAALKELQKLYDSTQDRKQFNQKDAIAATPVSYTHLLIVITSYIRFLYIN